GLGTGTGGGGQPQPVGVVGEGGVASGDGRLGQAVVEVVGEGVRARLGLVARQVVAEFLDRRLARRLGGLLGQLVGGVVLVGRGRRTRRAPLGLAGPVADQVVRVV